MNKFKLDLVEFPKLERKEINNARYYIREGSELRYPSVTSVTGLKNAQYIQRWRNSVGEKEANRISARASGLGTAVHNLIERYIKGEEMGDLMPIHQDMFDKLRVFADNSIGVVKCIEGQMFSDHLAVAGTADLIAEVDGQLAVVDWKTSSKKKTRSQITNYFMQSAAYAVMFEERTGLPVSDIKIAITCQTGEFQLFEEKRDNWIKEFQHLREQYRNIHGV